MHADRDVLPIRRRRAASTAVTAVAAPAAVDATTVTEALGEIHGSIDSMAINGVLVATRDGLVLCAATRGIENDGVAAMAAAAAGLATQFTAQAKVGEPRAAFFEGEAGQAGVFPVDAGTLLVVLGERDTTMGMFNVAAKQALSLLQKAIADRN
jgi:predicted regulator of Ras-like GTPase activity (Roadblock/LC7/MglB family)